MKKAFWIVPLVLVLITVVALVYSYYLRSNNEKNETQNVGLANPASVYCVNNNGTLEMREDEKGQYGVCIKNGKECEEWAYYRG